MYKMQHDRNTQIREIELANQKSQKVMRHVEVNPGISRLAFCEDRQHFSLHLPPVYGEERSAVSGTMYGLSFFLIYSYCKRSGPVAWHAVASGTANKDMP